MKVMARMFFLLLLCLSVLPSKAVLAHGLSLHPLQQGQVVKVHAYWADGTNLQDGELKTYDQAGRLVFQGITDNRGICIFNLPRSGHYRLVVDAGMGHRAEAELEYVISPAGGNTSVNEAFAATSPKEYSGPGTSSEASRSVCVVPPAMLRQIDAMLDRKLRPVLEELSVLRERDSRIRLRDVIGGLGYIFGFAGLSVWFAAKNRRSS